MQTIELLGAQRARLGYGTMRLPGPNVMGPPKNPEEAVKVLRLAIDKGIEIIDTAWYYGPEVANNLVAKALYPYPDSLLLITKLGGARDEAGNWIAAIQPDELRSGMEMDLRLLKVDAVPIVHLRCMPGQTEEQFERALDAMLVLQQEGKFKALGLSNVTIKQLDRALQKTKIVSVSNAYNMFDRSDEAMVVRCAQDAIAYLPFFPLAAGKIGDHALIEKWCQQLTLTPHQLAITWLLRHSPTIVPIPGTSQPSHLLENIAAANSTLPDEAYEELSQLEHLSS